MLEEDEDAMEDVALTRYVFQHGQRPRRPRVVRSVPLESVSRRWATPSGGFFQRF